MCVGDSFAFSSLLHDTSQAAASGAYPQGIRAKHPPRGRSCHRSKLLVLPLPPDSSSGKLYQLLCYSHGPYRHGWAVCGAGSIIVRFG